MLSMLLLSLRTSIPSSWLITSRRLTALAAAMFSSSVKPQLHVDNYIAGIKGSQSRQSLLSLYLVLIRYNNHGKKQQLSTPAVHKNLAVRIKLLGRWCLPTFWQLTGHSDKIQYNDKYQINCLLIWSIVVLKVLNCWLSVLNCWFLQFINWIGLFAYQSQVDCRQQEACAQYSASCNYPTQKWMMCADTYFVSSSYIFASFIINTHTDHWSCRCCRYI